MAVDPDFAVNQYVYVYYTATAPTIHNRVSRFITNGNVAIPGSETVILELETLGAVNHNGGAIHFGADGKLYVGVGDNATPSNAQILSNRLGKMLRINSDGSIPADNPYYATASGPNRAIWAIGLRNPFTFAVQPGTGRIFINDVGQDTWEEMDEGIAGSITYRLSILQMEVSRTQVFDRSHHGRGFFEEVLRDNLDLGRPSRVQLLFPRKDHAGHAGALLDPGHYPRGGAEPARQTCRIVRRGQRQRQAGDLCSIDEMEQRRLGDSSGASGQPVTNTSAPEPGSDAARGQDHRVLDRVPQLAHVREGAERVRRRNPRSARRSGSSSRA